MSIQSEIDRIEQNVADTYSVLSEMGAPMPASMDSDNLAGTAANIAAVLYNGPQNLTTNQQTQARDNIGAISTDQLPEITQEAGNSETKVMSQKAITDFVSDAIGSVNQYETVDSVADMTDTTKQYILSSTGTIWSYGEVTTTIEPQNKLIPSTATLNARLSGSSASVTANSSPGSFVTDFIAVSDMANISPYNARLNWELVESAENKIVYFNSSKTRLGNTIFNTRSNETLLDNETVLDLKKMDTPSNPVEPTWADVAYVRFQLYVNPDKTAITIADIENLTIIFEPEGGTITENTWYDTGLKPQDTGGNYVTLLVKINQNTSDINEVANRVTALENGNDTVTVPTFWQSAVDACITKVENLQNNAGIEAFTFPFFSDNHTRNGYAGVIIKAVMDKCYFPFVFYGGDSISSGTIETEDEMLQQAADFDLMMSYIPSGRICRALGNHDGYWLTSAGVKNYYTRAQSYSLFLREESTAENKYYGTDGTYYYIDDLASKIRFIVFNTNGIRDSSGNIVGDTFDSTQLSWLQNTALVFDESGWSIVFISHQPISNHYHANINNAQEVINVISDYMEGTDPNKATVIAWFSGHIHRDRIYSGSATNTSDDSEGTPLPFKQVTITSDNTGIAYDDSTKHPVSNDDQSHAIDFVTINKATRTVNLTRLGIGNDRSFTY